MVESEKSLLVRSEEPSLVKSEKPLLIVESESDKEIADDDG